jgi:putative membrane protein
MPEPAPLAPAQVVTQLLAAERTFLAWVRTSIAIASLGFVVAKFGIWLRELAAQLNPNLQVQTTAMSLPIGIGMMIFGGLLTLAAAWHFRVVSKSIEQGRMHSNRGLVTAVTVGVVLLTAVMVVYLILASDGSANLRLEPA